MNDLTMTRRQQWTGLMGLLSLLGVVIAVAWHQAGYARTNALGGDEVLVLFVWNHPYLSHDFYAALASQIMAPPGDFALGALLWRILHLILPGWSHAHLELAARAYPMLWVGIGTCFLGLSVRRVTRSWWAALLLIIPTAKLSSTLNYYATEVRFYAGLYVWACLAWWAYLRLEENDEFSPGAGARFSLIPLVVGAGFMCHFYSIFTGMAALIGSVALLWRRQALRVLTERQTLAALSFLAVSLILCAIYIRFYANGPDLGGLRGLLSALGSLASERTLSAWRVAVRDLLPNGNHLVVVLVLLWPLSTALKEGREWRERSVMCLFVIFCSLFVAALQKDYLWSSRYILFLIPSMIILTAHYIAVLHQAIDRIFIRNRLIAWMERFPLAALVSVIAVPALTAAVYRMTPDNDPRTSHRGGDTMVRIRRRINAQNLRVVGVLGITPNPDHSLAESRGRWVGMNWQLYSKGVRGLPSIRDYNEEKKNGGLEIVPCSQAARFVPLEESQTLPPGSAVYLDYCPDNTRLVRRIPT